MCSTARKAVRAGARRKMEPEQFQEQRELHGTERHEPQGCSMVICLAGNRDKASKSSHCGRV